MLISVSMVTHAQAMIANQVQPSLVLMIIRMDVMDKKKKINTKNFIGYVLDDSTLSGLPPPNWDKQVISNGEEITETLNSMAGLKYDPKILSSPGIYFDGNLYIDDCTDDDYVGFIFGHTHLVSSYIVMWKRANQKYFAVSPSPDPMALAGLQLKKVDLTYGASYHMAAALWKTGTTYNLVNTVWLDQSQTPWYCGTRYNWQLIWCPKISLIRIRIRTPNGDVIIDSENIYDTTSSITSGGLGVFDFSQEQATFSEMTYACSDECRVPQEVYDDLPNFLQDKVTIDTSKGWTGVPLNTTIIPLVAHTEPKRK